MKIPEPSQAYDPANPRQLGKYELVCRIGIGGMAEVFLARQKGFHKFRKLVVVKAIHPHLSSNQKFIKLLLYEARVSALLKHPRVVDIYDLGMEDGQYFIAMEYLPGQPLTEIIKTGLVGHRLDTLSAIRIFADVADGLHAAHTLKAHTGESIELVHRDVSPANIIVLYDGNVKLVDFGISKARGQLSANEISEVKGKLGYAAPEQLKKGGRVDLRADIFSLGVVMWESLTHKRLFSGGSPLAVLEKMRNHKPPPVSMLRDGVPREVDGVIARALHLDPDKRYQSVAELRSDLEAQLRAANYHREENLIGRYMEAEFADQKRQRELMIREAASHTSQVYLSPDDAAELNAPDHPDDDDDIQSGVIVTSAEREARARGETERDSAQIIEARSVLAPEVEAEAARARAEAEAADAAASTDPAARPVPALDPADEDDVTSVDLAARQRPRTAHPPVRTMADHTQVVKPIKDRGRVTLARTVVVGLVLAGVLGLAGGLVISSAHDGDDDAGDSSTEAAAKTAPGPSTELAQANSPAGANATVADAAPTAALAAPPDAAAIVAPDAGTPTAAVPGVLDAGAGDDAPTDGSGDGDGDPAIADGDATGDGDGDGTTDADPTARDKRASADLRRKQAKERRERERREAAARAEAAERERAERAAAEAAERERAERKRAEKERAERKRAERERKRAERERRIRAERERRQNAKKLTAQQRRARRKQATEAYQAGIKLFIGGKLGPARARFTEAIRLSPGYALPHRGLGLIYERQGKRAAARRELQQYLRMSPKAKDADAIRARLKRLGG